MRIGAVNRSPGILVFLGSLALYSFFFGGTDDHVRAHMSLIRALTTDQTVVVDPYVSQTHDLAFHEGHYYVAKPPGFAFTVAPFWMLAERVLQNLDAVWRASTLLFSSIPGAAAVLVFFLILVRLGTNPPTAVALAAPVAFGTGLFSYSTLFLEVPLVILSLLTACWILLLRIEVRRQAVVVGLLVGYAVLVQYIVLLAALPPAIYFLSKERRSSTLALFLVAFSIPLTVVLLYNSWCFSDPFQFGHFTSAVPLFQEQHEQMLEHLFIPRAEALVGLLFSLKKGLLVFSPFLVLALVGFVPLSRSRFRAEALVFAGMFALTFLLVISLPNWPGGVLSGPRYLLPLQPVLAIGLAGIPLLARGRIRSAAYSLLVASSIWSIGIWSMLSVLGPFSSEWLANPILHQHVVAFSEGRFRPNLATELLGVPGLPSLLPGALLAGALWIAAWVTAARARRPKVEEAADQ